MNGTPTTSISAGLPWNWGVSYTSFRRSFKRHTGLPPNQYLQQIRMDHAKHRIPLIEGTGIHEANRLVYHYEFEVEVGVTPDRRQTRP